MICNAGRNYLYISHQGIISRCTCRNELLGEKLGTIEDIDLILNTPMAQCNKTKECELSYLGDWNRSSRLKEDGSLVKGEFSGNDREITTKLNLTGICNMGCFYCKPERLGAKKKDELPVNRWIEFLEKISSRFDRCYHHIQGTIGEPLGYDGIEKVAKKIVDLNDHLHVISNLSIQEKRLRSIIDVASPDKVRFGASMHPSDRRFDMKNFVNRVVMVKKSGFYIEVLLVGVPSQIYLYPFVKDIFAEEDIPVRLFRPSMQTTTEKSDNYFNELMNNSSSEKTIY